MRTNSRGAQEGRNQSVGGQQRPGPLPYPRDERLLIAKRVAAGVIRDLLKSRHDMEGYVPQRIGPAIPSLDYPRLTSKVEGGPVAALARLTGSRLCSPAPDGARA